MRKEEALDRLYGAARLLPILIILSLLLYIFDSSAREAIDGVLPIRLDGGSDGYPAFLSEEDISVKSKVFEDGTEGVVIEIRRPVTLARTGTGSMQPMFGPGNLLVQEEVDAGTFLNVGDIVVYRSDDGSLVVHQIVAAQEGCFVMKGLNNAFPDGDCVDRDMIEYRLLFALPTG